MKNLLLIVGIMISLLSGCKSDEPSKELSIDDLLYSAWSGQHVVTMENGTVEKTSFIILFTTTKEGEVTFLSSTGEPVQNFPIYYRIEGNILHLQGAFNGNYRVLKNTDKVIEMEAYLPNHSLMTLYRKK